MNLDELSRKICPNMRHFVAFSSASCGRGNAGQSNYGWSNSVMERIIENRFHCGLSAKAIQWGAIGDVGILAEIADEDVEIGGTWSQEIRSCLDSLDLLLSSSEPIVSSMVVADKKESGSTKGDIIETILKIMGLRDRKMVSMHAKLARLGIDSLMGVEIRQVLERDFNLALTAQELNSLNLADLERKVKSSGEEKSVQTPSKQVPAEIQVLVSVFGDEKLCNQTLVRVNKSEKKGIKLLLIPGMLVSD